MKNNKTKVEVAKFSTSTTTYGGNTKRYTMEGLVVDWTIKTGGNGLWSSVDRNVKVKGIVLHRWLAPDEIGIGDCELRVVFDMNSWRVNRDGLIYTDKNFMVDLRKNFDSIGVPGREVDYTEQGRQGNNYVSCSIGKKFFTAWADLGYPIHAEIYV